MITIEDIAEMRQLASDAIRRYGDEALSGGCPAYPAWADKWINVCDYAANKLRFEQSTEE